ncbi:MAG: Ig-like domain-containing protein [candidate division KSB1 bacterium]|nr:Ig-like domain-containing protein [candidate division KSB1 bacterium]
MEWSFTTGASTVVTPPTVISTDPADAETDVALNQKIAATFSTTMDSSTISTATFTLMQGSTPVSGVVSYSGETAVFAPSSNLEPNTTYTATITTGAKDLAGTALENNYEWSFSTVISYTVTLSSNPAEGGTTSGGGTYNSGSSVTVVATPNTGYSFTNWTENGTVISTNESFQFIISENRTLVANFTSLTSGPAGINLGSAGDFAVLAGSGVSNTGVTTHIYGDVGSHPTGTIVGLSEENVTGTLYTTADPDSRYGKN